VSLAASREGLLEAALRRDRLIVSAGLLTLVGLAWAYIVHLANIMPSHMGMAMPQARPWNAGETAVLAVMWTVMMVAMMIPSAAPVILLFANISRRRRIQGVPAAPVSLFVLGYLMTWTGYAVLAALVQSLAHSAALLSPAMASASPLLGGGILLLAGVYQWLPVKGACLSHCRSPLGFLSTEWREGVSGALIMGFRHGSYCVGCCWALMLLLFVAGVMNLLWVLAIAGFVLAEKVAPHGRLLGRVTGVLLAGWGVWVLVSGQTWR
jgi:predicted metal-binding membrane protein